MEESYLPPNRAYILYCNNPNIGRPYLTHFEFMVKIVESLLESYNQLRQKRGRKAMNPIARLTERHFLRKISDYMWHFVFHVSRNGTQSATQADINEFTIVERSRFESRTRLVFLIGFAWCFWLPLCTICNDQCSIIHVIVIQSVRLWFIQWNLHTNNNETNTSDYSGLSEVRWIAEWARFRYDIRKKATF